MHVLVSVETDNTGRVIGVHTSPVENESPEPGQEEKPGNKTGSQATKARDERARKKAKRKEAYKQRKQNRRRG